jgi:AraC-like DNA-binding protein
MGLGAPWGISFRESIWVPFHYVDSGSCWLMMQTGKRVRLEAGSLVVLFGCQPHRLCDEPGSAADPLEQVLKHKTEEGNVEAYGGDGALTRIICGKFGWDEHEGPPASFRHLPQLFQVHRDDWPEFGSFSATLRLLAGEFRSPQPGGELARRFLTQLLLIHVLRVLLNGRRIPATGWLRALRDPAVAAALAAIHDKPENPWSLESLAAKAGLSRSVFAARFRARLGETPMAYVARWRLRVAARWLRETDLSVSEVLHRLGYTSAPAFNRAFKRTYRVAPSEYRRHLSAAESETQLKARAGDGAVSSNWAR